MAANAAREAPLLTRLVRTALVENDGSRSAALADVLELLFTDRDLRETVLRAVVLDAVRETGREPTVPQGRLPLRLVEIASRGT